MKDRRNTVESDRGNVITVLKLKRVRHLLPHGLIDVMSS